MKIKNISSAALTMLPLLPLLISHYVLLGLITWILCFILLIAAKLISPGEEKGSVLCKSGWTMFAVIIAYCGIRFAELKKPLRIPLKDIFANLSFGIFAIFLILTAISWILIVIGGMRKRIITAKLWEYAAVIIFSVATFVLFGNEIILDTLMFPIFITAIFFFTDFLTTSSNGRFVRGYAAGITYNIFLAMIINALYGAALAVMHARTLFRMISLSAIPDSVLWFAMAGLFIMIFLSAVFRDDSTLNNAESSYYLSALFLIFVLKVMRSEELVCVAFMAVYAVVGCQFVFYNGEGNLTSAIQKKIKLPTITQNLIATLVIAAASLLILARYNITAYVFIICFMILILLCMLFYQKKHNVIAFGVLAGIYIFSACILVDQDQISTQSIIMIVCCLIAEGIIMLPICMKHEDLYDLNKMCSARKGVERLSSYRKKNNIYIWIVYGVFWASSLWICANILNS